jgi:hypothetical protein
MQVRTMAAAAMLFAAAGMLPAAAEPDTHEGYNTGDDGIVAMVYNAITATDTPNPNGSVEAHCEYHQQTFPNSNDVILVVEGHAHVLPHGTNRAVSTSVRCLLRNIFNNDVAFDGRGAIEGSNGLWVPPKTKAYNAASYEVCGAVEVTWSDTTRTGDLESLVCEPVDD